MSARATSGSFDIVEHRHGELLRLRRSGMNAMDAALTLLGLFEAELDADVEDTGRGRAHGRNVTGPALIQLEGLEVELTTDANEIMLSRIAGSEHEFEELCEFVREHGE